jgi:N-acetylglucosamine-6-sulfatase
MRADRGDAPPEGDRIGAAFAWDRWGGIVRTRPVVVALAAALTLSLPARGMTDPAPDPAPDPATARPAPIARPAAVQPTPNVVVILLDDARLSDLSTLPRVRSLIGKAGATFRHAYSPFPLCCPARATMLTGQYAHNHGVLDNKAPLGGATKFRDGRTLATWLTRDYTTGFIGKYLNEYRLSSGRPPGWDNWMIPVGSSYDYREPEWSVNGERRALPGYRTYTTGRLASRFIADHADDARPFFLFTSIVAPHAGEPLERDDPNVVYQTTMFPTPNVSDNYRNRLGKVAIRNRAFNEPDVRDKPLRPAPLAAWEIDALKEVNGQRRESLLSAQDVVRRIVDKLRATGELDNTYVVFTSDNGYVLGEHRIRGGKVLPYEVTARVPLLIRGPGIKARSRPRQTVGLHDLAPTILAMTDHTGANGSFRLDGVNLLPMIGHPKRWHRRPVVLEAGPESPSATAYRFHGVVARIDGVRWKYVERDTGDKELYRLTSDGAELFNRAGRPGYRKIQARLRGILLDYRWCSGADCR